MTEEPTKTCFKCGETKPLSEFYRHPQMSDGHLNKCIECSKAERKAHVAKNPDAVLKTRLKQCERKPNHRNAYRAVEMAVAAGVLSKPSVCSACGCPDSERRIEAHHHDYSKPLDVIWLCSMCHDKADQLKREYEGSPATSRTRPVVMMRDGETLCRFPTIAAAAKAVGRRASSISAVLAGKAKTSAGFQWAYEGKE